jgi:hypothetical protein
MVRIAISQAAFDAIVATMAFGTVNYEVETDANGDRLIWLDPGVVAKLRALRGLQPRASAVCRQPLVADQFPATDLVAGVADRKQVRRRVERAINRILNAERFRDRRFSASLANVTAPDCDIVCDPKHRGHVGRVFTFVATHRSPPAIARLRREPHYSIAVALGRPTKALQLVENIAWQPDQTLCDGLGVGAP